MFDVIRRGNFILGPYRFENGTPFDPPAPPPFVPDRNFDGDSIYGLSGWTTTPETKASEHLTSLAPSASELITFDY